MTRVLLLAYHCNPDNVSEPRVVFEWACRLQGAVELTVLTHDRNRRAIERDGSLRCRVWYVSIERWSAVLWRLNAHIFGSDVRWRKLPLSVVQYILYELEASRLLRHNKVRAEFDVMHRMSPKSLWWPTLCIPRGFPFVLGPINSGMDWPIGLRKQYARRGEWLLLRLRMRVVELMRSYSGRVTTMLVCNRICRQSLPPGLRRRSRILLDAAARSNGPMDPRPRTRGSDHRPECLRLLFVGRLVPLKGLDLLLRALADCGNLNWRLHVAGGGDLQETYVSLAHRLGLADRIVFLGNVPHGSVLALYEESDIFVFPSVRESGGNAVYEAVSAGLPVIAVNHGGPAEILDDTCALLITPQSVPAIIGGLTAAIRRLAVCPILRGKMALQASKRVLSLHSWDARLCQLLDVYGSVLG